MRLFLLLALLLHIFAPFSDYEALAQVSTSSNSGRGTTLEQAFPCALGGGCNEDIIGDEDIISADPTFIQVPSIPSTPHLSRTRTRNSAEVPGLVGEILIPRDGALVRANVPIFGRAYGDRFKEYRIEYGQGVAPHEWIILETSTKPQIHNTTPDKLFLSADLSIEGNLGTWDTGLKNYVYLPTHPRDHPINFKGTYTLRLVVTSLDGQTVEDRVTVHVANVIPNAWGGIVRSPDEQVLLSIPEQSITSPFRLILLQATTQNPANDGQGRHLIGYVYEVKDPGEKFTKNARLEMKLPQDNYTVEKLNQMAIYGYDAIKQNWTALPSFYNVSKQSLFTSVTQLHAFYAVMSSPRMGEGALPAPTHSTKSNIHRVQASPISTHYLFQDTFEDSLGQWSNRDGDVGAVVSIDTSATFDGTQALKLVNGKSGGNFAVHVRSSPFDAREYSIVEFDYRMEPGVKTSFYAKVSGRWYKIGLTDDETDLKNMRVNIANLGVVPGILTDDTWHTARFNLYEMLQTKTGHTVVEELIMADWDVPGFMRLQYGTNQEGATYYIDNFAISRELSTGFKTQDDLILVDNFNQKKERNNLRRHAYTFQNSDTGGRGVVRSSFNIQDSSGHGHSLALSYDVSSPNSYGGYVSMLPDLDLRGFHALSFSVKGLESGQDFFIGLKDSVGNEQKISLNVFLPDKIDTSWKHVMIPLIAFGQTMKWGTVENLSISVAYGSQSQGTILLDDITFHKHIQSVHVDSFEQWRGINLLGGEHRTFANGAAAVNGNYTRGSPNGLYRLSYGGNIGAINAYASDLLTYAGWATRLGGIDCSRCHDITFRVRGGQGHEKPNIYLDDGTFRWSVDLENYITVTTEWQSVTIPLEVFASHGVDLTHLEEFQVVFEWEQMSSTLYFDDVWFGKTTQTGF